jgi:hypothetical protein
MKKLLLIIFVLVVGLLAVNLFAEEGLIASYEGSENISATALDLKELPAMKQGAIWDIKNHVVTYITTMPLITFKDFSLEGGYVDPAGIVGALTYRLYALKELGLGIPILDYIEFNLGFGYGVKYLTSDEQTKNEEFYGASLTLINVKF